MIPILWSFAPDEPEGTPRGSAYVSGRDVKILAIVLVALIALLTPVYLHYKGESESSQCLANVNAMFKAVGFYTEDNNDRFPPAYVVGPGESPMLFDGKPFTWASLVVDRMNPRRSFRCPSADEEEVAVAAHPSSTKKSVPMTYGMYVAMSAAAINRIVDPSNTILIAETSNHGARGTYNPKPFVSPDGVESLVDGFLIGYDTGNQTPAATSEFVTRLAFRDSKSGPYGQKSTSRHSKGIHVLYASGQAGTIQPRAARLRRLGSDVVGLWATR